MPTDEPSIIDLNLAEPAELESIEGIDAARAQRIVEYRIRHGLFRVWEDLEKVPGLDRGLVEKVRQRAVVGSHPAPANPLQVGQWQIKP